jgi:Glycosyl hydrolases family 32 N-terminal domain/FlgD Ig-like domain
VAGTLVQRMTVREGGPLTCHSAPSDNRTAPALGRFRSPWPNPCPERNSIPLRRPTTLPRLVLLSAFAVVALLAPRADASWMVPGPPYRPKDFALVKRDGLYHLFYIRRNVLLPYVQAESDLGHAVSKDLWSWTQLPGVIPARPTNWDQTHIWAPSLVEQDGVWYMFYTGVSDVPGQTSLYQRTGIAISTDLMSWNRLDAPVWSCGNAPWSWCDSLNANTGFRDPHVMADPAHPGHWLMYTTTFPESDHGGMVLDVASSDGDLTQWSDVGPLWITNRAYTGNVLVESPHLFDHNGLWYLFFTTGSSQPISFATGANPVGEPNEWDYRGRLGTMLGLDTGAWYASEQLHDGLVDYFAFAIADRIETYRMVWSNGWQFSLTQPDFMHVYSMSWDSTHVAAGDSVTLKIAATAWQTRTVRLQALAIDSAGVELVVIPSSVGLPDSVALDADTTRVRWAAQVPDPAGPSTQTIRVRVDDRTAATGSLAVEVAPPPPPPPPPPPDYFPDPIEGFENRRDDPRGIVLRSIIHGPYGARPTFLIEMTAEAPVRLDLYDLQGRLVRNLALRQLPVGATLVEWDGRDAHGAHARPGVYFARMTTGLVVRTARVVVVPE